MTNEEKYALLDKLGLCHECHKAKQFSKWKYCPECIEKIAARNARKWAKSTPRGAKESHRKGESSSARTQRRRIMPALW